MNTFLSPQAPLQLRVNASADHQYLRIIISTRVAPTAVVRNRLRRRIREAFRRAVPGDSRGFTVFVRSTAVPPGKRLDQLILEIVRKFDRVSS